MRDIRGRMERSHIHTKDTRTHALAIHKRKHAHIGHNIHARTHARTRKASTCESERTVEGIKSATSYSSRSCAHARTLTQAQWCVRAGSLRVSA